MNDERFGMVNQIKVKAIFKSWYIQLSYDEETCVNSIYKFISMRKNLKKSNKPAACACRWSLPLHFAIPSTSPALKHNCCCACSNCGPTDMFEMSTEHVEAPTENSNFNSAI
ncbi:hypothetical protein LXL04_009762 [Taraxacum kok-saghyz]